jgi:hypothetical protein
MPASDGSPKTDSTCVSRSRRMLASPASVLAERNDVVEQNVALADDGGTLTPVPMLP